MKLFRTLIMMLVIALAMLLWPVVPSKHLEPEPVVEQDFIEENLSDQLIKLDGRAAGTKWERKAALILSDWFKQIGLSPLPEYPSYLQEFKIGDTEVYTDAGRFRFRTVNEPSRLSQNVIGILPGRDPEGDWIIFSAHYDGQGEIDGQIYPSANDNLSGIMALAGLAKALAAKPPLNDTLLFAAFGSEEVGLLGSSFLAENLPVEQDQIRAVINLDTIGRTSEAIHIYSTDHNALTKLLETTFPLFGFKVETITPSRGLSDHYSFAKKDIKAVTISSTNWQEGNHTPEDTLETIDKEQLGKIATALKYSLSYLTR